MNTLPIGLAEALASYDAMEKDPEAIKAAVRTMSGKGDEVMGMGITGNGNYR